MRERIILLDTEKDEAKVLTPFEYFAFIHAFELAYKIISEENTRQADRTKKAIEEILKFNGYEL
jgi:hypothetical protein